MSTEIQTRDLGFSILGTPQVDYTVDGKTGYTYAEVVALAGLQRATAVEAAVPAYTAEVRARQRKAEDLGTALANISATYANFESGSKTSDTQGVVGGTAAYDLLAKYSVGLGYFESDHQTIKYENIQKLQTEIQYALDVTNNDLQQDTASLQGFVSKRDNAYQMANKLMQRAIKTRATGIKYIG